MLTIFTTPKAFKGHFATIQENAIVSWCKIRPKCQIILLGSEKGVAEIAKKYKLEHISDIKTSDKGTPIVSDLFLKAQQNAKFPIVAYVNSDLIFLNDFQSYIQKIKLKSFLVVGKRWELDIKRKINFDKNWRRGIAKTLQDKGEIKSSKAIDYFILPKTLNLNIPPLIIGRWVWDNWFLYQAKKLKIPLIDATSQITAIHQSHDYSHVGGFKAIWLGEEHKINMDLTPDKRRSFNIDNADWVLTNDGLTRPKISPYRFWKSLKVYPVLHPNLGILISPITLTIQFVIDRLKVKMK